MRKIVVRKVVKKYTYFSTHQDSENYCRKLFLFSGNDTFDLGLTGVYRTGQQLYVI